MLVNNIFHLFHFALFNFIAKGFSWFIINAGQSFSLQFVEETHEVFFWQAFNAFLRGVRCLRRSVVNMASVKRFLRCTAAIMIILNDIAYVSQPSRLYTYFKQHLLDLTVEYLLCPRPTWPVTLLTHDQKVIVHFSVVSRWKRGVMHDLPQTSSNTNLFLDFFDCYNHGISVQFEVWTMVECKIWNY